ncbi:hypothetical protein AKJ51_01385 [candidate division MSBL1 archaeon SCGC-AAA382A20]|uniref:Uncharacterized protein n=1 Tax=candidate division MSBL1 archaeon SCGC-AAA382A20 TaxID=1698280 RepID=A0A133VLT0_9EURY|nr:hypothetical protein AKJ51_01385 [candidate division MSBL1 archaeon SCGC-AAA382A20]
MNKLAVVVWLTVIFWIGTTLSFSDYFLTSQSNQSVRIGTIFLCFSILFTITTIKMRSDLNEQ